ncbi:hypothetical protein TW81_11400 [Vibrio galatheae]|uniref:Uncharacterized protein n=1 Tax=Vibrio galatheae TaxID=579748 RepID=A0A0F4NIN8_9VIBR|nr:hypothetical protein [Vibrio galatheae]KJY82814.1 hypothetical protein TW81_11400 [Vibrio galatheae]
MLQRIVSYLWLFTLALAMPAQAFAYLLQAENEAAARLDNRSHALLPLSKSGAQALFDQVKRTSQPETQSDQSHDWLALITTNRLLAVARYLDENETPSGTDLSSFEPIVPALFRLYQLPKLKTGSGLVTHYSSSYRISGWKESNTLYVALNGHYSLTFSLT